MPTEQRQGKPRTRKRQKNVMLLAVNKRTRTDPKPVPRPDDVIELTSSSSEAEQASSSTKCTDIIDISDCDDTPDSILDASKTATIASSPDKVTSKKMRRTVTSGGHTTLHDSAVSSPTTTYQPKAIMTPLLFAESLLSWRLRRRSGSMPMDSSSSLSRQDMLTPPLQRDRHLQGSEDLFLGDSDLASPRNKSVFPPNTPPTLPLIQPECPLLSSTMSQEEEDIFLRYELTYPD